METLPPVPSEKHSFEVRLVVDKIRELKAQFDAIIHSGRSGGGGGGGGGGSAANAAIAHDMAKFWHRKSKKVVLAVLLVLKEDEGPNAVPKLYTGTNMEVSERRD